MFLKKITLHNFKNIADLQLSFSPKINCISGNNGAGKTNLLDAVYYLSMTKSFFSSSDQYIFRYGEDDTLLNGVYESDDSTEKIVGMMVTRNGEKVVKCNGKAYNRFSDHIGQFPIVMVSPADTSLINDSGDERRKYMNFILSQIDKDYLRHIQAYNTLLLHRNKLLKADVISDELMETVSEQMIPHAQYVYDARKNLCHKLLPLVKDYYGELSGDAEDASLEYRSDLDQFSLDELFRKESVKDRLLRYTSSGIQRDDILFSLDEHPLKKCGSQGQQKTYLLAMKMAQFTWMKSIYGVAPLLLLDDVFDKLDMSRVEYLLGIVAKENFGQIFITDSNKVRMKNIVDLFNADCKEFNVASGIFSEI